MIKRLDVDDEFRNLISPLSTDEYKQLEQNLIDEGCRDKLIIWEGVIVDGHNRYKICHENEIPFETKEMFFDERNEVIEWIIRNQLGRRNLELMKRGLLILKLKDVVAEMAEKNISSGGKNYSPKEGLTNWSKVTNPVHTRKQLAKDAGIGEGSLQRIEKIKEKGTPEQLERADIGGKGNTVNSIYEEIVKKEKESEPLRVCSKCGEEKPLESFYFDKGKREARCKVCHNANRSSNGKDTKGNTYEISPKYRNFTEAEVIGDLYDVDKIIIYTIDDLNESLDAVVNIFCRQTLGDITDHKDLINSKENIKKITTTLLKAAVAVKKIIGDIENE